MLLSASTFILLAAALLLLAYNAYISFAMIVGVRKPDIKTILGYTAASLLCGITGIWIATECI